MSDKLGEVLQRQKQQINEPENIKDREEIEQLVGFIVGDEEFAIPILYIKEIIKPIEYKSFCNLLKTKTELFCGV